MIQFRNAPAVAAFKQNWSLGSWSVATQVGEIIRTQMFPWLLAIVASDATAGIFGACAIIAALPTPLHVALSNILLPQFVQRLKERGAAGADQLMWAATGWLSGVMIAYFLVIAALSGWIVPWVYGPEYTGTQHTVVVLTLAQVFAGASLPAARALFVLHRPDQVFYSHLAGIAVNLSLGAALVNDWGIPGAAYATLAGAALKSCLEVRWYFAEAHRQMTDERTTPARSESSGRHRVRRASDVASQPAWEEAS